MLLRTQDFTPDVYYRQSRDFQFIGRLFDVVLNSVKTNADMLYSIPLSEDSDERLLQLMTLTLGFKPRHQYNNRQLKAFCSVFAQIIRNKGNAKSFQLAIRALANAQGLQEGSLQVLQNPSDPYEFIISIPPKFKGKTLLRDLLDYILPAGMSCRFISNVELNLAQPIRTQVAVNPAVVYTANDVPLNLFSQVTTTHAEVPLVDDTTLEPMQARYVGDINYSMVISELPSATLSAGVAIETTDAMQKIAEVANTSATIQLYNTLSDIAEKQSLIQGDTINE